MGEKEMLTLSDDQISVVQFGEVGSSSFAHSMLSADPDSDGTDGGDSDGTDGTGDSDGTDGGDSDGTDGAGDSDGSTDGGDSDGTD